MVGAVVHLDLHVGDRVAGDDATGQCLFHAFVHRGDELTRDATSHHGIDEFVTLAWFVRGHAQEHMAILATATCLLGVLLLVFDFLLDGFAVGDLGGSHIGLDLEFAFHALHQHIQMQFAHARNDGLVGLLVGFDLECGILLGQFLQSETHLFLVALGLGLDGDGDDRSRELDGFEEHDGVVGADERVAGADVFEPDHRANVASRNLLDLFAIVGMHLHDAADAVFGAGGSVVDVGTGLERAGIHANEHQAAHKRVGHDLERERGQRLVRVGLAGDHLGLVAV